MAEETEAGRHVLFVSGPLREQLYRRFTALFDGRDDVEVRLDRRVAERRGRGGPGGVERRAVERRADRRSSDRRRARPEWIVPPSDDWTPPLPDDWISSPLEGV